MSSIFKEHKSFADRSASDRRRHRKKIERAIKDGIHHIVAEESIIGKDGKKKIRIPVKGIKEYRFIYGENNSKKIGSAPNKNLSRGQKIGTKKGSPKVGKPNKPGNKKGEEFYEVEITLEELAEYLFDNLELPDLEKKQMKRLMSEKIKRHGYRNKGIRPRLDKKKTVIKKLKRKNIAKRNGELDEDESFSFNENDLKYRHFKPNKKEHSNAVIFFLMDVSGSMSKDKKYIARSFFFLLYQFVRSKYEQTDLVFVAHDTGAYEVSEEQFFQRGSSGGTLVSSGLEEVHDIIMKRFHPSSWNIYLFQCSDGDNWPTDNIRVLEYIRKLELICQLIGYCEIEPREEKLKWMNDQSGLSSVYQKFGSDNVKTSFISAPTEIWPAFKTFFEGKR